MQIKLATYAQHKALHCTAVRELHESILVKPGPCITADHEEMVEVKQKELVSDSRATATIA